jgi:hypothetical protein
MRRTLLMLACLAPLATAAAAQDGMRFSLGYAYLNSLEEGGGDAPLGFYVSLAGSGSMTLELDGAYHRQTEGDFKLDTYTLTAGPRFSTSGQGSSAEPYLHILGGLRHDRFERVSNTAWGGMAGLGVDIGTGGSIALRLGGDFQIFFDNGENVKTLRLNAGITF